MIYCVSYKAAGPNATDEYGSLDTVEFINVSKDDALAYPSVVHRTYPRTVNARMEDTITPFVHEFTYQAMIYDLLELKEDKYK